MSMVNPMFMTRAVKNFVSELINDYGRKKFTSLSTQDQYEFAGLLIEACDNNSKHEFLLQSSNLDQTINAFTRALFNDCDDTLFLETMKDNAVTYFHDTMKSIFNEILDDENNEYDTWSTKYDSDKAYDEYRGGL